MATFRNAYLASATETPRWERTADGFLRTRARILKEGVMPYANTELGDVPDGIGNPVNVLVGMDSLSSAESLRTLEGCPIVTWDHNWLDPETISTHGKGAVAGAPRIVGPYAEVDILVTHPDAIADIESGKIGEISAAYYAESVFESGDFDGQPYDAKQVQLRYNHIAIIPVGSGRCGLDVKILNKLKQEQAENKNLEGGRKMEFVKVRLRNTKRIINTDEEGAAAIEAEEAASEAKGAKTEEVSSKSLEESVSALEGKNGELAQLQSEIEELKGELSVYKEKLDKLLSEKTIEHAAECMNEEAGEADEILENCALTASKPDEIKNARFVNGRPLRGEALHRAVLTTCSIDVENMSAEAVRGAFKAQNQIVKKMSATKVVAGTKVMNSMQTAPVINGAGRTAHQKLGFA